MVSKALILVCPHPWCPEARASKPCALQWGDPSELILLRSLMEPSTLNPKALVLLSEVLVVLRPLLEP